MLFERLAIDLLQECSVAGAAALLRISWDEAWGIKGRAVTRGLGVCPRYDMEYAWVGRREDHRCRTGPSARHFLPPFILLPCSSVPALADVPETIDRCCAPASPVSIRLSLSTRRANGTGQIHGPL